MRGQAGTISMVAHKNPVAERWDKMPAQSKAQFRFMEGVAHGGIKAKGLSPSQAQEYVQGQSPKGLPNRVKKAGDGTTVGDDYVDAPTGSLRAKLEQQRQGASQYGAIPAGAAKDPLGTVALLLSGFGPGPEVGGGMLAKAATTAEDEVLTPAAYALNQLRNPGTEVRGLAAVLKMLSNARGAQQPQDILTGKKDGGVVATVEPTRKGEKPIKFKEGGEHASLGVPQGQKIPAGRAAAARAGKEGGKAQKQELFRENVLKGAKDGAVVHPPKGDKGFTGNSKPAKTPTGKSTYSLIKDGYGHGQGM